MVNRQTWGLWLAARSRSRVPAILAPFTVRTMSPFWKPTVAAGVLSSTLTTATPSLALAIENSSDVAGEMFTTVAPANGDSPLILISSRAGRSGAGASASGTSKLLPSRRTDSDAVPPMALAPSR